MFALKLSGILNILSIAVFIRLEISMNTHLTFDIITELEVIRNSPNNYKIGMKYQYDCYNTLLIC